MPTLQEISILLERRSVDNQDNDNSNDNENENQSTSCSCTAVSCSDSGFRSAGCQITCQPPRQAKC